MPRDTRFFTVGGSLSPDSPSYIPRRADRQLLDCLHEGQLAYVLDTRQVGKSSLMVRVAQQLRSEGRRVALLDLSGYGAIVTPEQWFLGLLYSIAEQMGLGDEAEQHWTSHQNLGLAQRWTHVLRELVLAVPETSLVVFIDEIDAVASLPFAVDSFFAAVRECHNRRAHDTVFTRITFCLLGVATPSDLIRDARTTPFNVAQRIELTDFTHEEAAPLAEGLGEGDAGRAALARVLFWTGGHPYLTQRLCRMAVESGRDLSPRAVDEACGQAFLSRHARATDDNLRFAGARLLAGDPQTDLASILALYDRVRRRHARVAAGTGDVRADVLQLSGIVRTQAGCLSIRNRIYAAVFDAAWVRANTPGEEARRQRRALVRGYTRASAVWMTLAALLVVALTQTRRATQSDREVNRVTAQTRRLEEQASRLREGVDTLNAQTQAAEARLGQAQARVANAAAHGRALERRAAAAAGQLRAANREAAAQRLRALRSDQYIGSMSGQIASAFAVQPETGYEALDYGLRAVMPALKDHRDPPLKAANGLIEAVNRDVFRRLLLDHDSSVTSLCFSPDRRRLLTAGKGRYAFIWSVETGSLLQRLVVQGKTGRSQVVNAADYSADGRRILIASDQAGVSVWDATKPDALQTRPLLAIPRVEMAVQCAAISPDGETVALATPAHNVMLYDIAHRTTRVLTQRESDLPRNYLWSVVYSHSGKLLATASEDGTVKVWDAASGALLTTYDAHATPELSKHGALWATFDHWDERVVSAGKDGIVRVWWWRTNKLYKRLTGHVDWVWHADVSPFDFYIATAGRDRRVLLWSFGGNEKPLHSLNAHGGQVYCARFDGDGSLLATASEDHTVSVWQIPVVAVTTGEAMTYATYSHDGRMYVSTSDDGYARLNGPAPGRGGSLICPTSVKCAAFSPDDRQLATCEDSGEIRLWSTDVHAGDHTECSRVLDGQGGPVASLNYSPDGKCLVSGGRYGSIAVWNLGTGYMRWRQSGHKGSVVSLCYSADGKRVLSASADGSAALWDAATGVLVRRYVPPGRDTPVPSGSVERPHDAAFSPDGRYIATADGTGHVFFYDLASGRLAGDVEAHRGDVLSLCFNRAGDRLATAGSDSRVYVWRASDLIGKRSAQPEPLLQASRHVDQVVSVRYSPDGKSLITASKDNTSAVYPATIEGYVAKARAILAQRPAKDRRQQ